MIIIYLRNVGDGEDDCWVVCNRADPGAVAFEGFPPKSYWKKRRASQLPSHTRGDEAQ